MARSGCPLPLGFPATMRKYGGTGRRSDMLTFRAGPGSAPWSRPDWGFEHVLRFRPVRSSRTDQARSTYVATEGCALSRDLARSLGEYSPPVFRPQHQHRAGPRPRTQPTEVIENDLPRQEVPRSRMVSDLGHDWVSLCALPASTYVDALGLLRLSLFG